MGLASRPLGTVAHPFAQPRTHVGQLKLRRQPSGHLGCSYAIHMSAYILYLSANRLLGLSVINHDLQLMADVGLLGLVAVRGGVAHSLVNKES